MAVNVEARVHVNSKVGVMGSPWYVGALLRENVGEKFSVPLEDYRLRL